MGETETKISQAETKIGQTETKESGRNEDRPARNQDRSGREQDRSAQNQHTLGSLGTYELISQVSAILRGVLRSQVISPLISKLTST